MTLSGVRSSWLILARNALLARLAASACSRACTSSCVRCSTSDSRCCRCRLQFLKRLPQPADDLSHRDGVDQDGLYDHGPDSQWRCLSLERKTHVRHLQNRKYQGAEQAPTRCPYGGFVSEEPGRRGWQGHVKQRSRAVYTAVGIGDERRPDPSACEVGQTGALEVAEPEQHECNGVTRFQKGRIEYPWEAHLGERYRGDPRRLPSTRRESRGERAAFLPSDRRQANLEAR